MAGHRLTCTFCKRSQDQVRKLVAGPGVYICDACVERAHAVVHDGRLPAARPSLLERVAVRLRRFARRTDRSVLLATGHGV